jgi:molecular chaperone HscB
VRRGLYLLKLRGIDLGREDAGAQKDMPLSFLEEVMELREALDGAREAKDVAAAQKMGEDVSSKLKQATESAFAALREAYGPESGEGVLREAAHQLGRVRYFQRFLEEVSAIEEEALG